MARIRGLAFFILWLLVFSFLVRMMLAHFHQISASRDPMDEEIEITRNIAKHVPQGSQLAFSTNIKTPSLSQLVYYQAQFGVCPLILSGQVSGHENILFYQSSKTDSVVSFLSGADTISQQAGNDYTIMLLHQNKKY